MKNILFILLISIALYAQSKRTCYTVQLLSAGNTQENLDMFHKKSYPKECRLMEIGESITIRCGCYDAYSDAGNLLEKLSSYKEASIATTYKYRFDDNIVAQETQKKFKKYDTNEKIANKQVLKGLKTHKKARGYLDEKAKTKEDEELRLILQVFLYKGDLKNAYKVASLGYKKHPRSYYWNEKMAEICKWTNRSARSMKHLRFIYELRRDPVIEKELIDYGTSAYQYETIEPLVINRAIADPSEKNIDLMIFVFKKIGSPEKVLVVLDAQYKKDRSNTMLLTKALELSLEMGDLDLAKKYVRLIEVNKPYSKKDAALIARYYYITHDMQKSYASLNDVEHKDTDVKEDDIKYYELKSDLGWYLQDTKVAALASKKLMDMKYARLVDYERISFVYQKSDPKLAQEATRQAYKEYKLSYMFYSYANAAINAKNFVELQELLQEIDVSSSPLAKEALFWMIKAKVYAHFHKFDKEQNAMNIASALDPDNFQIQLELLWFYMDMHDNTKLKNVLTDMAESDELGYGAYLPMASAYFYLNDINRASYYTQELLAIKDPTTQLLEFKFLQAYIYQIQNNEPAFKESMTDILHVLKAEAKKSPRLKKDNKYLSNYLRAAMYVLNPDKFEKKLKKAKKHLSKKNYNEISYSWAMKNHAYEKTLKIYHKIHKKELWMQFNNAIVFQEHSKIEDMLNIYLYSLSMGDAAQASKKDGQIALSQTISFEGLRHNEKNQNMYIEHMDISKERSDLFEAKTSYYNRDPLLQKYIDLDNKTYLQDGYSLLSALNYFDNSSLDKKVLVTVPAKKVIANIGLKKLYDRGYIQANVAYHDSMKSYLEYSFDAGYRMSTDLLAHVKVDKNGDALESTQLLLGGKKDMLALDVTWNILNSTSINFLHEFNSYDSQDNVHLGSGNYSRITLSRQIRNGYPDLKIDTFYDAGFYDETSGSRGVIDDLQAASYPVLPANFYNVGLNFSYGLANSSIYTRVWRPYFEFSPYYNSEIDSYTYGLNAGIGGKVWHQDHLVVGASYTDSVNGVGGSIFELFLKYQFMYYHP